MKKIIHEEHHDKQENKVGKSGKFLTFMLENEKYGIEIGKVIEIIGLMEITPVPQSPQHLKGVINLRGKVIPVIDMRLLFGMGGAVCNEKTCIIVVVQNTSSVGLMVDAVSDVASIELDEVKSDISINTRFLRGISNVNGKINRLINIDEILNN